MRYLPLVVACAVCLLLGGWIALRFSRWLDSRRGRARNVRGQRGERNAEQLLIDRGYTILARQQPDSYLISVDATPQQIALVLDFVVERNGEQWVAEVKTGNAASLSNIGTRRQLLEYQLAFGGRHVLLVDPEAGTITEVAFPITQEPNDSRLWPTMILVATIAALTCWWLQTHH